MVFTIILGTAILPYAGVNVRWEFFTKFMGMVIKRQNSCQQCYFCLRPPRMSSSYYAHSYYVGFIKDAVVNSVAGPLNVSLAKTELRFGHIPWTG